MNDNETILYADALLRKERGIKDHKWRCFHLFHVVCHSHFLHDSTPDERSRHNGSRRNLFPNL